MQITKTTKIGWIGTGVMGFHMCQHLLNAGYNKMTVFNRTTEKAQPLAKLGATIVSTPKEVALNSDVVFTIVGYPSDVENLLLGTDGVISHLNKGSIVIDCTTSKPSLAQTIHQFASEREIHSLDAPVSGGDIGAKNATLSFMIGGSESVVETVKPLFQLMGKNITYMGSSGMGQHTKMVNQILISTMMIGMCEGLIYGKKAGLDLDTVIRAVGSGAAGSWSINNLGPRIIQRLNMSLYLGNFEPGFFVEHFLKDLGIALEEARRYIWNYSRMDLSLPGLALAHQLYIAVKAQGHGRLGTHALQLALENLNNVEQ